MSDKIEMPSGFIRTWKAFVLCLLNGILGSVVTGYIGHSYARVETKEVRIEVPPKACRDGVIFMSEVTAAACDYPEQVGALIERNNHTWYECTCPRANASVPK